MKSLRVESEIDLLKINGLSSEQIMAEAQNLHARWPKMNSEARRRIVESLVNSITVGKGEISLNLCYLPTCEEMTIKQRTL